MASDVKCYCMKCEGRHDATCEDCWPQSTPPRVTSYASAQSEDGSSAGDSYSGDTRANVMLSSQRYELTATITNGALTVHVHDNLLKTTAINVTLS